MPWEAKNDANIRPLMANFLFEAYNHIRLQALSLIAFSLSGPISAAAGELWIGQNLIRFLI